MEKQGHWNTGSHVPPDEGEVHKGEEVGLDCLLLAYPFGKARQQFSSKSAWILAPSADESILCQGVADEQLLPVERTLTLEMHVAAQAVDRVGISAAFPAAECDLK